MPNGDRHVKEVGLLYITGGNRTWKQLNIPQLMDG